MRCTDCGTRSSKRTYHRVKRKGGGNYRRPARWYDSTMCDRCVEEHVAFFIEATDERRGVGQTTSGTNYSWWGVLKAAGRDDLIERLNQRNGG